MYSRRSFLTTTMLGGVVTGGSLLRSAGQALAAEDPDGHRRHCGCPGPTPAPGGPGPGTGTAYTVTVTNNSAGLADFCVYQSTESPQVPNAKSLAWLTRSAPPSSAVRFNWNLDYSFVWGNGTPAPGSVFQPGQVLSADPTVRAEQQAELDYAAGQYLLARNRFVADPQPGNLYIRELSSLPIGDDALVGIGMSGAGTHVVPTLPNQNLVFAARPTYFIAAGTFAQGEVLDVEEVTGGSAALSFPPGVFELAATLNADNTWTVRPGLG